MNSEPIRTRAERLRAVPLTAVLRAWGAQPDPHDPHKWHTPQGVLSVTGPKFMNWSRGVGGGGAIDLVLHLNGGGFGDALDWLARRFASVPLPPAPGLASAQLRLPASAPAHLSQVRSYLVEQRRLRPELIDGLIQTGSVYADHRANAVFLLRGVGHMPVGAELRGTTAQPWRGMAPGSKKDRGFFSIPPVPFPPQADPNPLALLLCESAIDAISAHMVHPHLTGVSTAGARPNPRWLDSLLAQGRIVYCGFDTDATGEAMAQATIAFHPAVQRWAPPGHDWNDVLRSR
jgi:hypothetical protein